MQPIRLVSHLVLPSLAAIALLILCFRLDLDHRLAELFYDRNSGKWPFKHSWWAETLIHSGGRKLVISAAVVSLILLVESLFSPLFYAWRRSALYLLLCIGLSTGLAASGKQLLNHHCPWSLQQYGGSALEQPWSALLSGPVGQEKGHCFPSGHAAGGFALSALYFVLRDHHARLARLALVFGLSLGVIFSIGQMARGAHFLSHNIVSAWLCWCVATLLFIGPFRGRLAPNDIPLSSR
ncbi:MAG: phosphatase PAP2 family protein [Desulfuromonadaceae bacterium]|nr:phosphatase PAP2 family protein [Desulfuromonadaceae bacterium]